MFHLVIELVKLKSVCRQVSLMLMSANKLQLLFATVSNPHWFLCFRFWQIFMKFAP